MDGCGGGKKQKDSRKQGGILGLLGTVRRALLEIFKLRSGYVNLCPNCSAINNTHLLHKCQDQNCF